jgi:serine/threonine protein kinase
VQIARGLGAAHEKGIIHRDLKPDNLFVTKDGRVKILDFGLVKLTPAASLTQSSDDTEPTVPATESGAVLGTVGYVSPEQIRGQAVDHRTDIFGFGAVLYEMLSGRRAFRGETPTETLAAILEEDPPELAREGRGIPPALARIVHRCLEKRPEQRFHSARTWRSPWRPCRTRRPHRVHREGVVGVVGPSWPPWPWRPRSRPAARSGFSCRAGPHRSPLLPLGSSR